MLKLRKNKKGFTLVELIVVIAIMAVLAGTIAGVTVSQLNKQTNNTAKTEAQTLASDLHSFMIDYKLSAPENAAEGTWKAGDPINDVARLARAVKDFISENNQDNNIEVIKVGGDGNTVTAAPTDNDSIKGYTKDFKAGDHQFYAFVYEESVEVTKDNVTKTETFYKVRFCCKQKGNGKNQFPFADYTYSDVLADK